MNGKPAYLAIGEAAAAIRLMLDSHISGLLVIDAGRLVDILTEGNIGIRCARKCIKDLVWRYNFGRQELGACFHHGRIEPMAMNLVSAD